MSYKRVTFAGYFLKGEDKLAMARLFNCEKKVFLESSEEYAKYNEERIKYFPMNLFHMQGRRIWNLLLNRIDIDADFIKLYKRDLKIFKLLYLNEPLPGGKKTFFLFVYWAFSKAFKSGVSFTKILNALSTVRARGKAQNEFGFVGRGTYHDLESLKLFAFRLSFINGYVNVKKTVDEMGIGRDDLLVLWGAQNSGARLLLNCFEKKGANCLISEYGELPGTFSLNKNGIFGDSQIAKNWNEISSKKCAAKSLSLTNAYLDEIVASQSSSRGVSQDDQMFSFYKENFQPKILDKKVIYVSGVELLASGHLFDKKLVTPGNPNANEMLLTHVISHFSTDEYIVLYKDHPLMQTNYKELALNEGDFKGVIFVNSMNVDNLISMADITVTLPSKVIMTCLMYKKPVYAYGHFSIPETVPVLGYYTGRNVAEIKEVVDNGCNSLDPERYPEIVSELLQEYLIRYQSPAFKSYDLSAEQEKVEKIIESQLTINQ